MERYCCVSSARMNWENGLVEELSKLDDECSAMEPSIESAPIRHVETLFGPSVNSIWKKKKRKGRTGVTSTSKNLPTNISNLLGQANMKYISGDYEEAIELYHQLIQIAPKLSDSYLSIGLIYDELGNKVASFHYLQFALKHAPRNCDLLFKVAKLASDLGYYAKAMSLMNRIFLTEKSVEIYATRTLLNIELGYMKRAKKLLRDMMSRYPAEYSFLIEFGECSYRNHFYSQGIQELLNFISKSVIHFKSQMTNPHLIDSIERGEEENEMNAVREMQLVKISDELSYSCQLIFEIYLDSYETDTGLVYREGGSNLKRLTSCLTSEALEFQQSLTIACISTLHFFVTSDHLLTHSAQTIQTTQDLSENSVLKLWKESPLQQLLANHVRVDRIGDCLVLSHEMRLIQIICELERSVSEKIKPGDQFQDPNDLTQAILHCTPVSLSLGSNNSRGDSYSSKGWYACLRYLFPILANLSRQEVALTKGLESFIQSQQAKEVTQESNLIGVDIDPSLQIQSSSLSTEQWRASWLLKFIKTDAQHSSGDSDFDFYEIGDSIAVKDSLTGEGVGSVEYRHRNEWKFFLYSRVHIATLLLSLGMTKKALSLSREVSQCPFLIPEVFPPLTIATILKRHCANLLTHLMTPATGTRAGAEATESSGHSGESEEVTDLVHEILQVCVRVLEFNPNEVDCLVIFTTLCEKYQPEFVSLGLTMLTGHLETLMTHFKNSRLYFESHFSSTSSSQKPDQEEGEGDEEEGVEEVEEGVEEVEEEGVDEEAEGEAEAEEEEKDGEAEEESKVEGEQENEGGEGMEVEGQTQEVTETPEPSSAPDVSIPQEQGQSIPEYQGSLEENIEKIHSLSPPG
jgi:hypothetical protein